MTMSRFSTVLNSHTDYFTTLKSRRESCAQPVTKQIPGWWAWWVLRNSQFSQKKTRHNFYFSSREESDARCYSTDDWWTVLVTTRSWEKNGRHLASYVIVFLFCFKCPWICLWQAQGMIWTGVYNVSNIKWKTNLQAKRMKLQRLDCQGYYMG